MRWLTTRNSSQNTGGEALAPYLTFHQRDEVGGVVGVFQRAVGFDDAFQLLLGQPRAAHRFERRRKRVEGVGAYRQPGRHRVAAEFVDQTRCALRYQIKRVAQVEAGYRSSRTLDPAVGAGREGD